MPSRVNIVLALSDDQGWGDVGYRGNTHLRTPELDRMAEAGLRFERFYSGAPICSAARAALLTGRSPHRTGVTTQGQPLRLQERTLAQALRKAGYATGHFGKWHLDGVKGQPVQGGPVIANHSHNPGAFGFQTWLSNIGIFELDPILGTRERFDLYPGEPSSILVREAMNFMNQSSSRRHPFFAAIWFSNPHIPWYPPKRFIQPYKHFTKCRTYRNLTACEKNAYRDCDCFPSETAVHYGELAALDAAVGELRDGLRKLEIQDDTLLWFQSDNGPEPKLRRPFSPTGNLSGSKKTLLEGGIRVPSIAEWPGTIGPRVTWHPACAMDLFPTIAELVGLPESSMLQPQDGTSLVPLFKRELGPRQKPIPFAYFNQHQFGNGWAIIDNQYKLVRWSSKWAHKTYNRPPAKPVDASRLPDRTGPRAGKSEARNLLLRRTFALFDVVADSKENFNLVGRLDDPEIAATIVRLTRALDLFSLSMNASENGLDYPERCVWAQPSVDVWCELECYKPSARRITQLIHDWDRRNPGHNYRVWECGLYNRSIRGIKGDGSAERGPTTCRTKGSRCLSEWPWVGDGENKWKVDDVLHAAT